MRGLLLSTIAAVYLYGATESNSILNEVAKLRQKYEECRQGQSAILGTDPKLYQQCEAQRQDATSKIKGYQTRIANLETQIKENNALLVRLQTQNSDMARELSQKKGVVKSLEQTLTSRDQKYREAVARNEALSANDHAVKVSKIERESLKRALITAKTENIRLDKELKKILSSRPTGDVNAKLQAMQRELVNAQATIVRLQNTSDVPAVQEKVVYKDRPVIQEKIITKVVEPTERIKALQSELAAAHAALASLKSASGAKVVYKDRIVTQEKVVYKDRPVVQERIVYKDRPVIQEKIVTKVVEPTEKIKALQKELAAAQAAIANLKGSTGAKVIYKDRIVTQEKVVYKDRPVVQEKVVYKDRPVIQEKIVTKVVEPTEKIHALQKELATAQMTISNLKSAPSKVVVKEKIVPQERVVYKDRIVTQEKVVYKDRPVVQEKIVTKVVEPTEKIKALQNELASAQGTIAKLKSTPEKVVIKEKIVTKIVEPTEKIKALQNELAAAKLAVSKNTKAAGTDEATRRQIDKITLDLERQKSQNDKLKAELAALQKRQTAVKTAILSKAVATVTPSPAAPKTVAKSAATAVPKTAAAPAPAKKGASAYRMASDAPIYNAPNGRIIDTWEARRSFTAGLPSGGWVNITGYFVNRVWQPTREDENLWVKESDVIRR